MLRPEALLCGKDTVKRVFFLIYFFSVERNLEKTGTASGTFYQARPGQGWRVEEPEEKETSARETVA